MRLLCVKVYNTLRTLSIFFCDCFRAQKRLLPVRSHRGSGKTASPMRRERERALPVPFLSILAAPVGACLYAMPICQVSSRNLNVPRKGNAPLIQFSEPPARSRELLARSREPRKKFCERRIKFCEQRKKPCERLIKSYERLKNAAKGRVRFCFYAVYFYVIQRFFRDALPLCRVFSENSVVRLLPNAYALPVRRHRGSGFAASPMRRERERAKPAPFLSISAVPIRLYPQAKPLCREFAVNEAAQTR